MKITNVYLVVTWGCGYHIDTVATLHLLPLSETQGSSNEELTHVTCLWEIVNPRNE